MLFCVNDYWCHQWQALGSIFKNCPTNLGNIGKHGTDVLGDLHSVFHSWGKR